MPQSYSKPPQTQPPMRHLIIVSDGTGITAEKFALSLLAQFEITTKIHRFPFIDTVDKAYLTINKINELADTWATRPLIFTTLVNPQINEIVKARAKGFLTDLFQTFVGPLETELNMKSNHASNRMYHNADSSKYRDRIEAINFALINDDGQTAKNLAEADVILVGVSRCGKTPTSLYLAMQHGIKAANYPLIPEDFERDMLPTGLDGHLHKIFGLSIEPQRLSEIRNERKAGSKYASFENCRYEVSEAEKLMRRHGINSISTTHKSIEEISTAIMQDLQLDDRI